MGEKKNIDIGGLSFAWDLEKGQFSFEGEDAILFWISSAMKTLFDTIEEISGEEAAGNIKLTLRKRKQREEIFFRPITQGFLQDYSDQIFGTRRFNIK